MRAPPIRLRSPLNVYNVCTPCLRRLASLSSSQSRPFSRSARSPQAIIWTAQQGLAGRRYFLSNDAWARSGNSEKQESLGLKEDAGATATTAKGTPTFDHASSIPQSIQNTVLEEKDTALPHRRRRRKDPADQNEIPYDASSQLSTMSSSLPSGIRSRFFTYLALSKPRLSFLVVLTTTAAYSLFPVAATPLSAAMSLSPLTLLNLTTGTALCCASANTLNMLMEPAYDAKMSRTRNRPLVRGLITSRAALMFALATGVLGVTLLDVGVNPTCAFLGALNIVLYAGAYTPLKRISVVNTWVGAVVGGIPPLMGWVAAAGQAYANTGASSPGWRELLFDPATSAGGWLVAALLFAWQFPHFNSLSWTIRHEYANAGYRMLASINPRKNALVGLRYALLMLPICAGLSYVGVTGWSFVATSSVVNFWMIREAWRFYRLEGQKGSARGLFWASVWHLPIVLVLAMIHKRGLWERFWRGGLDDDVWEEVLVHEHDEERARQAMLAIGGSGLGVSRREDEQSGAMTAPRS